MITRVGPLSQRARWMRGAGLLALVGLAAAAQWVLIHRGLPDSLAAVPGLARLNAQPGMVGLALYLLSLAVLLGVLSDPAVDAVGGLAVRSAWKEVVVVLAVMALAAWARLYRLDEVPPGLGLDETDIARQALEIVQGARPWPWQVARLEVPWAYHYYVALFYWLLGPGYLTVKLPAVVGSVLAVVPLYLLAREMVRPTVATAVIVLYATSRWGVNVARWGHVNALTPFFVCLVLWLVWRGVHTGRWRYWIAGGLAMGLSQYGYQAARAIPVIATLFILWRAISPWGYLRRHGRQVLAFYALALLVYAPLGWTYLTDPLLFMKRGQGISVFNPLYTLESGKAIWQNVLAYVQAFHYRGDTNPRHNLAGAPQLEGITAALLVIGLGYALASLFRGLRVVPHAGRGATAHENPFPPGVIPRSAVCDEESSPSQRWSLSWPSGQGFLARRLARNDVAGTIFRPGPALLLIWSGVFLAAGVLTQGAPNTFRIYGVLPAFLLLCGLALEVLWSAWEQVDSLSADHLATAMLVAVVAWAGLDGLTTYFSRQGWQPGAWTEFNVGQTQVGQYLRQVVGDTPGRWHVYLSRAFYGFSPIDVINPGLATERLILPEHVPLPPEATGDTVYIVEPYLDPAVDLLQRYYPEGWREVVRDPMGRHLFTTFIVPAEATARRGLHASFWAGAIMDGRPAEELPVVTALADPPSIPLSVPYAQRLTGGLRLTQAGVYRFRLEPSVGAALLYLNDTLAASSRRVSLTGELAESVSLAGGPALWLPEGLIALRLDRVVAELPPSDEGTHAQEAGDTAQRPFGGIEWLPPGAQEWSPLPLERLLPVMPPAGGLIAAYYEGDRFSGKPVRVALDPLLLEDNAGGLATYAVRWLGGFDVNQPGEYRFRLRSDDGSRLYVGGQLLVDHWGLHGPSERGGVAALGPGRAPLEIRYFDYGGSNVLDVEWLAPGGAWQPLRQAPLAWDQTDVMQALSGIPIEGAVGIPIFSADGGLLGDLPAVRMMIQDQRWPHPRRDENFQNRLLKVKDGVFDRGIGTFGPTEIGFDLRGAYTRLSGAVGVDRDTIGDNVAWFQVELDGQVIWESGPRYVFDPALSFDLDVSGGGTLVLRTDEGGPTGGSDAVDWVNLRLTAR